MTITKQQVLDALKTVSNDAGKDIVSSDSVRNVVIFETEINVDVVTNNPTLHAKKKLEVAVLKAIHDHVYEKAKVNVRLIVEKTPETPDPNMIRGIEIPGVKNIVAIASGKGGVGKSTVTSNLAVTLAKQGYKVGLVDADIYGPSMPIMFDVVNERPRAIEVEGKSKIEPVESYGVRLLSIGFFAAGSQAVVWRGPMASKALSQLIKDADWGELDFLLIDLPPGTGDIHLSLVQTVPVTGAVVVSTPQNVALADAKKGVAMFQMDSIKVPVLGLIENMAYFTPEELPDNKYYIFGKDGTKNLAEDLKLPLLGQIPLVQGIREAGDVGHPAALQEGTVVAQEFNEIARKMVEQLNIRNKTMDPTKVVPITNMDGCAS